MSGIPELTPLDEMIGANAKALRVANGISQERMAEILDCSVPLVSQLENGNRAWKTKWIFAYSEFFNVHPSELLGGSVLSAEDQKTVKLIQAVKHAEKMEKQALNELKAMKKKKPK